MIEGNAKYHHMLVELIKQLRVQLPGKTTASVFFAACEDKADAALLLEHIWSWWEQGDDFVCNWTERKCGKEKNAYTYMFLRQSDLQDLWDGKTVPRRAIEYLKSRGFIVMHSGFFRGKQGRLLRLCFEKIYPACKKAVDKVLDKHQAASTRKSLLTRARMHAAQPFDLYTFQDIIQGTVALAYKHDREGFLEKVTEFNHGGLTCDEFRSELARRNPEGNGTATKRFEPDRIEWALPRLCTKHQHAGQRLTQTTSIFARSMGESIQSTRWQAHSTNKDSVEGLVLSGRLDLFQLQFIATSYLLNSTVRETMNANKDDLNNIKSDLNSPLLACHSHMCSRQDYNKEPFHPNQLIFNELYTLGWVESRVKFKRAERGKVLLNKLIIDNALYGTTSALQKLCIFGKVFPDELELIRKYVAETSKLEERSAHRTYRKLSEENCKLLRAMYPLVFPLIEKELKC